MKGKFHKGIFDGTMFSECNQVFFHGQKIGLDKWDFKMMYDRSIKNPTRRLWEFVTCKACLKKRK